MITKEQILQLVKGDVIVDARGYTWEVTLFQSPCDVERRYWGFAMVGLITEGDQYYFIVSEQNGKIVFLEEDDPSTIQIDLTHLQSYITRFK